MKKIIGLTGMSGSGKSTVASVFKSLGADIIDCDGIAHTALEDGNVINDLVSLFGGEIMTAEGKINRRELAARAFKDPESTSRLNSVTHPYILRMVKAQIESLSDGSVAVIDAPLLFNCGLDSVCDVTVAVTADVETLSRRIALRDHISEEQVKARLSAQKNMPGLLKRADIVIDNSESMSFDKLKATATNIYTNIINNDSERKM